MMRDPHRYFYDQTSNPGKFTPHQLVEIRRSSLARIHCDNGDRIKLMQPLSFRKQSHLYSTKTIELRTEVLLQESSGAV